MRLAREEERDLSALENSGFPAPPGLAAASPICVEGESRQAQAASGSLVKGTDREQEGKFARPGSVSFCFLRTQSWLCSCQKQGNRLVAASFMSMSGEEGNRVEQDHTFSPCLSEFFGSLARDLGALHAQEQSSAWSGIHTFLDVLGGTRETRLSFQIHNKG